MVNDFGHESYVQLQSAKEKLETAHVTNSISSRIWAYLLEKQRERKNEVGESFTLGKRHIAKLLTSAFLLKNDFRGINDENEPASWFNDEIQYSEYIYPAGQPFDFHVYFTSTVPGDVLISFQRVRKEGHGKKKLTVTYLMERFPLMREESMATDKQIIREIFSEMSTSFIPLLKTETFDSPETSTPLENTLETPSELATSVGNTVLFPE